MEIQKPEYAFDTDGARYEVWDMYFSKQALGHTVQNLKHIRNMALYSSKHKDDLVYEPEQMIIFQDMLTYLESLYMVHLVDESEVIRSIVPRDRMGVFKDKL